MIARDVRSRLGRAVHGLATRLDATNYVPPRIATWSSNPGLHSRPSPLRSLELRLAAACRRVGMPLRAQQIAERSLARDGSTPDAWRELARSVLAGGPIGLRTDSVLGVVEGRVGDPHAARRALGEVPRDARTIDDIRLEAHIDTVSGLHGDAERTWETATRSPFADATDWYEFGRARHAIARARGGLTEADARLHRERLDRALGLDPRHPHTQYHQCRMSIRAGDWRCALRAAAGDADVTALTGLWFDDPEASDGPPDTDPAAVVEAVRAHASTWPRDVLLTAHWWLHAHGSIVDAFEVKQLLAERILEHPARPHNVVDQIRSLLVLGDHAAAARTADRLRRFGLEAARRDKIRSDLRVLLGDVEHHRARARPDDPLRDLVVGRDVVVVGPHSTETPSGATVIRTKWLGDPDPSGHPTTISYYPETTAASAAPRVTRLLEAGDLELAVLRPASVDSAPTTLLDHPRSRVCPDEMCLLLDASPFGVQRIIYDVIRHAPRSLRIDGLDFFTTSTYPDAYRSDETDRARSGIRDSIAGYGHDLLSDFRWTRTLLDEGVLDACERVREVLRLNDTAYLRRVGAASATRPRSDDPTTGDR